MKRLRIAALCLLAATFFTFSAPTPVVAHSRVAPADEYFGRLKMSILGIRNTLNDLGPRIDAAPERALNSMALVEDALHDWQHKYPRDPWIPRMAATLAHLYQRVPGDEAQHKAAQTQNWIVAMGTSR